MIRSLSQAFSGRVRRGLREIHWQTVLTGLGLFAIFFGVMAAAQFSTPDMPDNDGFYHIKLAWIMRTQGLRPAFPWLPLTILNPREFYDHHFLFHVALIPFTFGDLRLGAKWAAAFFAALTLLVIWRLFDRQRIPYSPLWALGTLAVSHAFLYRMSITRAQSLSLAVLVLGLHWMLTRQYRRLLALGFFYVWMYNAFPLLPVIAGVYAAGVWLIERRFELRPLAYSLGGVALGILINPYFPINAIFILRHVLPKVVDATAIRVGNEWFPYTTGQLIENSLLSLAALGAGALALGLNPRRMDVRTAVSLLLALMTGMMLFQSRRFVEYFPAFALIFAAFSWAPLLEPVERSTRRWWKIPHSLLPAAVRLILIGAGFAQGYPALVRSLGDSKPYNLYAGASAWLERNTQPGERVFHTDWDDFPRLFFYNTHNTYIVGLDPTYLQMYDPALYDLWVKITQGDVDDPSEAITTRFAAQFVHTDLLHGDFIRRAEADPRMVEVYRDDQAVIFQIRP